MFLSQKPGTENGIVRPAIVFLAWLCVLEQVPSDPLKCAQFRAVARARDECLSAGTRLLADLKAFDRMLVKVPEHVSNILTQQTIKQIPPPVI